MKRFTLVALFCLAGALLQAQQFTQISQYMLNPGYVNPAWSGTGELYSLTALHRTQWSGYRDYRGKAVASQLQLFTGLVNFDKTGHTAGLLLAQDKIAYTKDFLAQASYAYRVRLSTPSSLSFGARIGLDSRTVDYQKYVLFDPNDPLIPQEKQSETHPDLTLGLWYNHERYYLGVSGKSLLVPGNANPGFAMERAYIITGGYHLTAGPELKVTPSVQVISGNRGTDFDLSVLADYGGALWGGLSYRHDRAAAAIVGVGFLQKQLRFSYAFDYVTSNAETTAATSHEVSLNFRFGELTAPRGSGLKRSRVKLAKINIVKDRDRDGVSDDEDKCAEVRGLRKFDGCPDTDNDGIPDDEDQCAQVAGKKALGGCPDTDGDNIPDADDACPGEPGGTALKGCPDRDGDGVADREDECPEVPGAAADKGCPASFTQETLGHVTFETGKATLQETSYAYLDDVIAVLRQYPGTRIVIEGHTDNEGEEATNLELSRQRAEMIKRYFTDKGIDAGRISVNGYGESRPVDTNDSAEGRQHNRRVEIHFIKKK